jgi:hypothetical protein
MATTTNYGWSTPDDTALVSQGAAAIRTLGSSVDTTVKALSPGTTAGDVDYYTSSTAKARLGIGTTGQVLTVAGGVPSWATSSSGGMTLLSTTTLSGATVTVSSISQSYTSLLGVIYGVTNATANGYIALKPLGNNNVAISSVENAAARNDTSIWYLDKAEQILRTDTTNAWFFQIYNYTSATNFKPVNFSGTYLDAASIRQSVSGGGGIKETSAITSLTLINTGGNLSTGTLLLYGVK